MTGAGRVRDRVFDWLIGHPVFEVLRWDDEYLAACGYDVRDRYVETYWLPILGPSAVLALRRVADQLEQCPTWAHVDLVDFGASLGIGGSTGRHTHINRTIARLVGFGLARIDGDGLYVRISIPPLPIRLRHRLPRPLYDALAELDQRPTVCTSVCTTVCTSKESS